MDNLDRLIAITYVCSGAFTMIGIISGIMAWCDADADKMSRIILAVLAVVWIISGALMYVIASNV